MDDNLARNPFARLFTTPRAASLFLNQPTNDNENESDTINLDIDTSPTKVARVHNEIKEELVQEIFGLLLNNREMLVNKQLVRVDCDNFEEALFERLSMKDITAHLHPEVKVEGMTVDTHVIQTEVVSYLFNCHVKLFEYTKNNDYLQVIVGIWDNIHSVLATALEEPEALSHQNIYEQLLELFSDNLMLPLVLTFIDSIIKIIVKSNPNNYQEILYKSFQPVLDLVHQQIWKGNILTFNRYWTDVLITYASRELLAEVLIRACTPDEDSAFGYAYNALGAMLSLTCLPKISSEPWQFFNNTLSSGTMLDREVCMSLDTIADDLHKIFDSLLRCSPKIRNKTLRWLGKALDANSSRGRLANVDINNSENSNDGFMITLSNLLLRLSYPFCTRYDRVPKIDPTYCAAIVETEEQRDIRGVHIENLHRQTCLIPTPTDETRPVARNFNVITELFYFTHRALDLGFRTVLSKLMKSAQDLNRLQRVYNDARNSGNHDVIDAVERRLRMEMTKYHSFRACLISPGLLKFLAKFHATTAFWLMQCYADKPIIQNETENYYPKSMKTITFPVAENLPITLRCIPEFVVENTVEYILFLRRFHSDTFEEEGLEFMNPILTELIILMASSTYLFNPHLRAQLAEAMESLLPTYDDQQNNSVTALGTYQRTLLFETHMHRGLIPMSLLEAFVGIEMTGQSVQFEQKFYYRRPMYVVMNYLWDFDEYKDIFKRLASKAEINMEAVTPPLFLRFINLLMNDAVFLLDEAFANMAQLKKLLESKENGEWDNLPLFERNQQMDYLQYTGNVAKFDNILGRETITIIKKLTTIIKSIFCHPTMVDRIASMLNYLLLQLTGPKNRTLKVKDQEDYEFDPANLVLNICEIYINLGENENFTLAVSQDGRSYKPDLFKLADNVLVRIGGVGILNDLDNFSKRVETIAHLKQQEEEILINVPDEFVDPIMMTLMMDPVILPSSKVTVDRQTIARHILSDQTDPFNRSPLTMDMVMPNEDLAKRIHEWIASKKKDSEPLPSTST